MESKLSTAIKRSALLAFMTLTCGVASAADEYKIKLTRPETVGTEYNLTVSMNVSRRVEGTVNGNVVPPKKEKFTVEMAAKYKIDAVEEKFGQATKVTVTVEKLTKDGTDLYPAGTVITAEKDGKDEVFKIDGEKVEGENGEILSSLIDLAKKDKKVCDDQMRGTDKLQKVGGTWEVTPDKIVEDAGDDGITVSADKVKGQSTLVEVKDVDGIKQMSVKSEMKFEDAKMDLPNANGATVDDSTMSISGTSVFPVDDKLPETSRDETVKMRMNISLPNNTGSLTVITEEQKKMTWKKKSD